MCKGRVHRSAEGVLERFLGRRRGIECGVGFEWVQPRRTVILSFMVPQASALATVAVGADWCGDLFAACDELIEADGAPAVEVAAGIGQLQRLINWAQASQSRLMVELAEPDTIESAGALLDLAHYSGRGDQVPAGHPVQPVSSDFELSHFSETTVARDELWSRAVRDQAIRLAGVEVAAVLGDATVRGTQLTEEAVRTTEMAPQTVAAWRSGELDQRRVRIIADRLSHIESADLRGRAEERILQPATGRPAHELSTGSLRKRVDRVIIAVDAEAAERRAEDARRRRLLSVTPGDLDMARLCVDLPAPSALVVREVLDYCAKNLDEASRGGRTLDQLRVDIFCDIFDSLARTGRVDLATPAGPDALPAGLDASPANCPGGAASAPWAPLGTTVKVTIAASTLAGLDDDPALLDGMGWVTAGMGRMLAQSASYVQALIHDDLPPSDGPESGAHHVVSLKWDRAGGGKGPRRGDIENPGDTDKPSATEKPSDTDKLSDTGKLSDIEKRWCGTRLDQGRTVYRPKVALDRYIRERDCQCQFPGCTVRALFCDLDHRVPFDRSGQGRGGDTCPCNLQALCRFHHRLKTVTRWRAERRDDELHWTTALGTRVRVSAVERPLDRGVSSPEGRPPRGGGAEPDDCPF